MASRTKQKAIYTACAEAARKLLSSPPKEHGGVFTELDVVTIASSPTWSREDWKDAMRQASQVCGLLFRQRKLCRFGPVKLSGETLDYARIATKIAYANPEIGPEVLKTPNGDFPQLFIEGDSLGRQGRRPGTNRDDLVPWDEQQVDGNGFVPSRVEELEAEVEELHRRVESLTNQKTWLEAQLAR